MPPGSDKVVALRRLLDARHPTARPRAARAISTGVPAIDEALGGLRTGGLTEWVSEQVSTGSQSALGSLVLATRRARRRIALVDAAAAFDLEGQDDDAMAHVVWVQCASLAECWRAADLVARDPNYAVTVIDVRGHPPRDLLRTREAVWTRLQRAAEQADTAVLIQSDTAIVPNASARLAFQAALPAAMLTTPRRELVGKLVPELQRCRPRAWVETA